MRAGMLFIATVLGMTASTMQAKAGCYHEDLVQSWYLDYLGRPADACGLRNWVGRLRSGLPLDRVKAEFLSCDEYYHCCGCKPRRFVCRVCEDLLHRHPCEREICSWTARLSRYRGSRYRYLCNYFLPFCSREIARRSRVAPPPAYVPPPAPVYVAPEPIYRPVHKPVYEPLPRAIPARRAPRPRFELILQWAK